MKLKGLDYLILIVFGRVSIVMRLSTYIHGSVSLDWAGNMP